VLGLAFEETAPDIDPNGCKNLVDFLLKVLNARADGISMSNIQIESKVAQTVPMVVAALDASLPRAEQIARIRAALEMLKGIAEE